MTSRTVRSTLRPTPRAIAQILLANAVLPTPGARVCQQYPATTWFSHPGYSYRCRSDASAAVIPRYARSLPSSWLVRQRDVSFRVAYGRRPVAPGETHVTPSPSAARLQSLSRGRAGSARGLEEHGHRQIPRSACGSARNDMNHMFLRSPSAKLRVHAARNRPSSWLVRQRDVSFRVAYGRRPVAPACPARERQR